MVGRVKILLTGASSFTGHWFVRELAAAGHDVVATFQRDLEAYDGVRGERVRRVAEVASTVTGCSFGSPSFMGTIRGGDWDVLCHHAADVTNYRSQDFDVAAALANNTRGLPGVLSGLRERGCSRFVVTGSYFENGEAAGSDGLPAFSPYGLSKSLTAQMIRHYGAAQDFSVGKFVIPNPFGPYEEPRFTAYLFRIWFAGNVAGVNTPAYVRDNIHVGLLAKAYRRFVEELPTTPGFRKFNPSGYAGAQGGFARELSAQMGSRLGIRCGLDLKRQTEFPEPRVRINTDALDANALGFDESAAWDALAEYYRSCDEAAAHA